MRQLLIIIGIVYLVGIAVDVWPTNKNGGEPIVISVLRGLPNSIAWPVRAIRYVISR